MLAVSSTASASGYLRDKALAQWIALNRLTEVRLNLQPTLGQSKDTGELDFAGRTWHYDTQYFDTSFASMRRVVVRVWPGKADQKGNPLAEYTGFIGNALSTPGGSNVDWTQGSTIPAANAPGTGTTGTGTGTTGTGTTGAGTTGTGTGTTGTGTPGTTPTPTP
jgi:type II secretion system protein I